MKKTTLKLFLLMLLFGGFYAFSQTLNQNAGWPNAAWTLSGTFTPGGLLSDPTTTGATFTWDDDAAGNGSADTIIATSPIIDLSAASGAGETWITVSGDYVYRPLGGDVLTIEVYDADSMTWSVLETFAGNTTTTSDFQNCVNTDAYTTPVLDIAGFTPNQLSNFQYRISYDDLTGWQWGWCLTAPTITSATPPACIDPSALTATSIADTSANLGWTENGAASVWDVEVVASGSAASGTPTSAGVGNPYTVMSLTPDTLYDFYVRANCGVDGTSNWVGPFTFRTACAAIPAPYTEDFETFTTAGTAFVAENCWSATGGIYFWESAPGTDNGSGGTGPDPSITTGNYFYTEASSGSPGDTTDLLSPLVDLSALTSPALLFNYHMFGVVTGTLDVIVNGTDNVWSLSGEQQTSATAPWELAVIDLSAYAGQSITVTFRGTSAGTFEGDISIDNVSFDELPACPTPNALTATNVTDTTADLSWTENGSATAWDIEIVDVTGGGVFSGTPTFSGVTNPYTATGLIQNNNYAYYVRSDCGGSTFSTWAGPFAFTTLETCPAPTALTAVNITETTADLAWTENGTATSWNIEIVDLTAGGSFTGTPTVTGVTSIPYIPTGLSGDNAYEFYVLSDCGVDGFSAWAGPFAFTTQYVAVPPDCTNGIFLDSGGNSGGYSSNESTSTTIFPDSAGQVVTVTFTYVDLEASTGGTGIQDGCWDFLTIYDGPDNTFPVIAQTLCGEESGDGNVPSVATSELNIGDSFTSTDGSGALTIEFSSDGSVQETGWSATVSCSSLSVEEFNDSSFTFYPNPVKNTLTLNAQNNIDSITMFNVLGQEVLSMSPNNVNSVVDMSQLQTGTYFVKVSIANSSKTIRVVKL